MLLLRLLSPIAASFLLVLAGPAGAVSDLTADWSDSTNPNGVWSYNEGANALLHVDNWVEGAFSSPQPAWARSGTGNMVLPAWRQDNGTATFPADILLGDIVAHTTDSVNGVGAGHANVTWTSPFDGVVDILGAVWLARDEDRSVDWTLSLNDVVLTGGSLFSGDPFSRDTPFDFDLGSGGAAVLDGIAVSMGDVLELELATTSAGGEVVGVDLLVTPEPSTLLLLVTGLGLLALRARRYPRAISLR